MRRISSVILSFTLFACVLSQDCNNPLLSVYNLTPLDQPESGEGLQWCSNLQNGQTCCSSDTVNNFQNLLNDLINSLEEEAGARDQSLVGLRNDLLDDYQNAVSDLTDNDDHLRDLTRENQAVGDEIRTQWNAFERAKDQLSDLDDDDDNDRTDDNTDSDDDNDFFVYLQNLQFARRNCLRAVIDVQSSLWCLACDANWAQQGLGEDGTLTLSHNLANSITQNCYNYTAWSQVFNPLLFASQTIQRVRDLNQYLRDYGRNRDVLQNNNVEGGVYQPVNANEKTVTFPPDCNINSCPSQSLLLLSAGSLNQEIAAHGAGLLGGGDAILSDIIQGTVVPSTIAAVTVEDLIRDGEVNVAVQDDSGAAAWDPNGNLAGIPFNVAGDPAQVSGLNDDVLPWGVSGSVPGGYEGADAAANGRGKVDNPNNRPNGPNRSDTSDTSDTSDSTDTDRN